MGGMPPYSTSLSARAGVDAGGGSCGSLKNVTRNGSCVAPSRSRRVKGPMVSHIARPASDSVTPWRRERLAEPLSTNRPGTLCSSTARLMATRSSGQRCTSSMVTGSCPRRRLAGSSRAASSAAKSSRVTYRRPANALSRRRKVVFPACRSPVTTTTGKVLSARRARVDSSRRRYVTSTASVTPKPSSTWMWSGWRERPSGIVIINHYIMCI